MEKRIVRTYSLGDREIREAICAWLKSKDQPSPGYVGDTDTVKWTNEPAGVSVTWTEVCEM